jgi:fucose permease
MAPLVIFLVFILLTRFSSHESKDDSAHDGMSFVGALKEPVVWLFCVTLGFMEVIEFGAANWGGLYLQDVYGLDPRVIGASFISLFYILFTLSRLCSGWLIERVGYIRSLQWAVLATMALFAGGFTLGRHGIWVLPVTGLFIAIMWPTIMAVAMQVFGANAPVATSAIITISGAINGVFQLVIGFTNQYAGYAWGYRSCLLYAFIVFASLWLLAKRVTPRLTGKEQV